MNHRLVPLVVVYGIWIGIGITPSPVKAADGETVADIPVETFNSKSASGNFKVNVFGTDWNSQQSMVTRPQAKKIQDIIATWNQANSDPVTHQIIKDQKIRDVSITVFLYQTGFESSRANVSGPHGSSSYWGGVIRKFLPVVGEGSSINLNFNLAESPPQAKDIQAVIAASVQAQIEKNVQDAAQRDAVEKAQIEKDVQDAAKRTAEKKAQIEKDTFIKGLKDTSKKASHLGQNSSPKSRPLMESDRWVINPVSAPAPARVTPVNSDSLLLGG